MSTEDHYYTTILVERQSSPTTTLSQEALEGMQASIVGSAVTTLGLSGVRYQATVIRADVTERGLVATLKVDGDALKLVDAPAYSMGCTVPDKVCPICADHLEKGSCPNGDTECPNDDCPYPHCSCGHDPEADKARRAELATAGFVNAYGSSSYADLVNQRIDARIKKDRPDKD